MSKIDLINCIFQETSTISSISSEDPAMKVTGASNVTIRKSKFVRSSTKCSVAIDSCYSILIEECSLEVSKWLTVKRPSGFSTE